MQAATARELDGFFTHTGTKPHTTVLEFSAFLRSFLMISVALLTVYTLNICVVLLLPSWSTIGLVESP